MAVVTALREQEVTLLTEQDRIVNDIKQRLLAEKESEKKQLESAFEAKYACAISANHFAMPRFNIGCCVINTVLLQMSIVCNAHCVFEWCLILCSL